MEWLRRVFDDAPVFAYAMDRDLRYLYLNRAALNGAYGGRSLDEMVGRTGEEFLPAEDLADLQANDRFVMRHDRPVQVYECILGHVLYAHKWPMHDGQGNVCGVAGVSTDVTSVVEERVRGSIDLDLMVDLMRNTSVMTRALSRMLGGGNP